MLARDWIGCLGHFVEANDKIIVALATIAIAFFTLTLKLSTDKLWTETRDASAIAKESAEAATIAARAAEENASTAKESVQALKAAERAYVFVEVTFEEMFIGETAPVGHIYAMVHFWNYGKTPAVVTKIRGYLVVQSHTPQSLVDGDETSLPPSLGIMSSGQYMDRFQVAIDRTQNTDIENWNTRVFCIGKIEYRDVLGDSHETGFCWNLLLHGGEKRFIPTRDSQMNKQT